MKPQKQNVMIILLLLALACSIVFNWLQGSQVSRLMDEIKELEYIQSTLSSYIEQLEIKLE